METTTKASVYNRELTKTEVEIAVAQIKDRLERVLKAQDEFQDFLENGPDVDTDAQIEAFEQSYHEFHSKIVAKYDLPEGVRDGLKGLGECCDSYDARKVIPFIKPWVEGKLTPEFISWLIIFSAHELDEYDYGFVFLDAPMWFWGGEKRLSEKELEKFQLEIISVGSRSKKKWSKLNQWSNLPDIKRQKLIGEMLFGKVVNDPDEE